MESYLFLKSPCLHSWEVNCLGSNPRSATLVVACWFGPAQLPLPMGTCCDFLLGCQPSTLLAHGSGKGQQCPPCCLGRTGLLWAPGEHVTRPNQHIPSPSHSDWFKRRHVIPVNQSFSDWVRGGTLSTGIYKDGNSRTCILIVKSCSLLHLRTHLIFPTAPQTNCYSYSHFTDKEAEAIGAH